MCLGEWIRPAESILLVLIVWILTSNRTRGARGGLKLPRTLRLRGETNQCASDTLAPACRSLGAGRDSRVQKPKNFLAFFSRLLPPPPLHREAEKEMERKFLVLLRHQYSHTIVIYHIIDIRHNNLLQYELWI